MLKQASNILALATGFLLSFSVLFDWAYFQIVDPPFFRMMNISDHLASFVERLPLFLLGTFIAFVVVFYGKPSIGREDDPDEIVLFEFRKFKFIVEKPSWYFLVLITLILAFLFVTSNGSYFLIFFVFFYYWQWIITPIARKFTTWGFQYIVPLVYFVPIHIIMALTWGLGNAHVDLGKRLGGHEIEFSTGDTIADVVILRATQHGMLLRDTEHEEIIFTTWDHIKEIKTASEYSSQSRLCRWFDICWWDEFRKRKKQT